jgi:hypothetical protein
VTVAALRDRPRLRRRAATRYPLVSDEVRAAHPAFAEDFAILDDVLLPQFYELDEEALRAQNAFRLGQVFPMLGGAVATALGAVQVALGGGVVEVGIAEAIVASLLASVAAYVRGQSAQREYFDTRLKAERLRGEYFRFLGGLAPYDVADSGERREVLRMQIAVIESGQVVAG